MCPTPDALLAAVIPRSVELAGQVDAAVLPALFAPAFAVDGGGVSRWYVNVVAPGAGAPPLLDALINGREILEDSGYRAPACIVAGRALFGDFNVWVGSNVATEGLLVAGNANSLHRATSLNGVAAVAAVAAGNQPAVAAVPGVDARMLMIGRRQEIAHGCAATASPGEEPVDLAVSVAPSLQVVGENAGGQIELSVRVSLATRIKDQRGVVVIHRPV